MFDLLLLAARELPCAGSVARRFTLERLQDATGVSGVGTVAEGVQLPSGRCVMQWRPPVTSVACYESVEMLLQIHGHGGATVLKWADGE